MGRFTRCLLIAGIIVIVAVAPIMYYRSTYTEGKRLREVVAGKVYRSGQMTTQGFEKAVKEYGIHTIVNLQEDFLDPDISEGYFTSATIKESALCRQLGVRYMVIGPDLVSRQKVHEKRPQAIERFLAVMDEPKNYPVLIHCKAGLHRTGVMVAIYRMEYEGWDKQAAIREVKKNGFGETGCTEANDYIIQYVLNYRPGLRRAQIAQREVLLPKNMLSPSYFTPQATDHP